MISPMLSLILGCCGLFVAGVYVGRYMYQPSSQGEETEVMADSDLFYGWDELSAEEQKKRLSLYQRCVRARITEQEREWLQARLMEYAKG